MNDQYMQKELVVDRTIDLGSIKEEDDNSASENYSIFGRSNS